MSQGKHDHHYAFIGQNNPSSPYHGLNPQPTQTQSILQRLDELERIVGVQSNRYPITSGTTYRYPKITTVSPTINLPDLSEAMRTPGKIAVLDGESD